jgi:hypothetical protein
MSVHIHVSVEKLLDGLQLNLLLVVYTKTLCEFQYTPN